MDKFKEIEALMKYRGYAKVADDSAEELLKKLPPGFGVILTVLAERNGVRGDVPFAHEVLHCSSMGMMLTALVHLGTAYRVFMESNAGKDGADTAFIGACALYMSTLDMARAYPWLNPAMVGNLLNLAANKEGLLEADDGNSASRHSTVCGIPVSAMASSICAALGRDTNKRTSIEDAVRFRRLCDLGGIVTEVQGTIPYDQTRSIYSYKPSEYRNGKSLMFDMGNGFHSLVLKTGDEYAVTLVLAAEYIDDPADFVQETGVSAERVDELLAQIAAMPQAPALGDGLDPNDPVSL